MNSINQLMEGLSHPVLQAMACTLGSYNYTTLRQIYEFHKLRVTPIEENCRVWLSEITRLRQAACHPRLINDKLQIPSSKTQAFLELVANLRQSGHRALVFSQFTSHLALVREEFDKAHVP